jgi:hypothetical protein
MVRTALVMALLLSCMSAAANVATVSQIVSHESDRDDPNGPWFIPPDNILDHTPFHRGMWEDWGWTHDMTTLVPTDANGIVSATLAIRTWGVDAALEESPEIDGIYAIRTTKSGSPKTPVVYFHTEGGVIALPGTRIGSLQGTLPYSWGTTNLTLPADILTDLWRDRGLRLFMNIDEGNGGRRVSLAYSMLTVNYAVPSTSREPNTPMHQFWSPGTGEVFWTANEKERDKLLATYPPSVWTYEGIAHSAYRDKRNDNVFPVYRFWSRKTSSHFYTMKESERDKLMAGCPREVAIFTGIPSTWTYEGIAFYAQRDGLQTKGAMPVYRFWSGILRRHCFTTSEVEKQEMERQPGVWQYEGIAWHTY